MTPFELQAEIDKKKLTVEKLLTGPLPKSVKHGGTFNQAIQVKDWAVKARRALASCSCKIPLLNTLDSLISEHAQL